MLLKGKTMVKNPESTVHSVINSGGKMGSGVQPKSKHSCSSSSNFLILELRCSTKDINEAVNAKSKNIITNIKNLTI